MKKSEMSKAFLNGELAVTLSSASEVDKFLDILECKGYPTLYLWREFMSDHGIDYESCVYAILRTVGDEPIFCVLTLEFFIDWLGEDEHTAVKYDTADQITFL